MKKIIFIFFFISSFIYADEYIRIDDFIKENLKIFKYRENKIALSPKEFVKYEGGDCEDYAIYTSALLEQNGYKTYIGILVKENTTTAHAVCLIYSKNKNSLVKLAKKVYYLKSVSFDVFTNEPYPAGYYIPVDFDTFGDITIDFSSLKYITTAKNIIGRKM